MTAVVAARCDRPARASCDRCGRPPVVCFCSHMSMLSTRTRILLLQHPRERRVAVGTARLAHLALPDSVLRVGLDFAGDPVVSAALADDAPAYVLFPGPAALDVSALPRDRALTLVVLDGTWWQARKLLTVNPALAALPRVAFTPRQPSGYRIRRQPADHCLSTIEALAEVLTVIEPGGRTFDRLLDPFRAMVARQEWFETEVRTQRHRFAARARRGSRRPSLAARLSAAWPRLVCVQGDANAWPARHPACPDPEIVHWVGHRLSTGQTYQAVVAPRRALAPTTPQHIGLPAERLLAGSTLEAWHRSWQEFARADDVLVQWGTFYGHLAADAGLDLGAPSIDLRSDVSQLLRRRVGTVDECVARLDATPVSLGLDGRAGRRLAALVAALAALRDSIHRML